ncbi:MAG: glycosyltransferase family 39 protein [Terracidiphilus sp.]
MKAAPGSQFERYGAASRLFRILFGFGLPLAAGLALRLLALRVCFEADYDALIYGGIAKNLLLHGRYALNGAGGELYPTIIRLPGYPLFLACCFKLFGMENYYAPCLIQIGLDLAACLLLADFARRIAHPQLKNGAAIATVWLAALCPFTASYAAMPLTEAPTIFCLALAMASMARFRQRPGWGFALIFAFAVTYAALLRPDGALAGVAFAPALVLGLRRPLIRPRRLMRMAAVCALIAVTPFVLWTARNWKTFHVVQPLAPRLAVEPDESPNLGWERWVKSWCLDYVSTYQIYWNVPGSELDIDQLPSRAFDTPAERSQTAAIAGDYNRNGYDLTPAIDARFGALARERIAAHPLRNYLWLPLGRVADMWLRPRVENLPIDLDWWVYAHHYAETKFSWSWAALNALYLLLALVGVFMRPKLWLPLVAYMLLRSALLLTVEAPEARYTLECFPMIFVLAGNAVYLLISGTLHTGRKAAI